MNTKAKVLLPLGLVAVAIIGAIDALFAPRMLKKLWEQQDRDRK